MVKILTRQSGGALKGAGPEAQEQKPITRLAWKDLRMCGLLLLSLPISWVLPERAWPAAGRLFARARGAIKRDGLCRARDIEATVGHRTLAMPVAEAAVSRIANDFVERLQMLRCYRPGGWRPKVQLVGREHLESVTGQEDGAILWFMPSCFSTVVSKKALFDVGIRLSYLSRYTHNLSATLWGSRVLNPIRVWIENRYLDERLVIRYGREREAFDAMKARLHDGATVGITVSHTARRHQDIDFLDGRLRLATAPAALAVRHRLPLIPVTTAMRADGTFVVEVHPPLTARNYDDLAAAIEEMLGQYGEIAEAYALEWPDQFWWQEVTPDRAGGPP